LAAMIRTRVVFVYGRILEFYESMFLRVVDAPQGVKFFPVLKYVCRYNLRKFFGKKCLTSIFERGLQWHPAIITFYPNL